MNLFEKSKCCLSVRKNVPKGISLQSRNKAIVFTLTTILCFATLWTLCGGVGINKGEPEFCYSEPECGPDSEHWGETCKNGLLQSPISLPFHAPVLPGTCALHLYGYHADAFRMRNTGHSVEVECMDSREPGPNSLLGYAGRRGGIFPFPDPVALSRYGRDERLYYKFDSIHFHWGLHDEVGSEHCFDDHCFSMELHIVHYLARYNTMEEAMQSGDPNALAVIAVMLDVTDAAGEGNPVLGVITHNLFQIEEPTSEEEWVNINFPINWTPLLATRSQNYMYIYKGSLTTPECTEEVNWYVFKRPIAISHKDVDAFRYLKSHKGGLIRENNRPLQNRNGRPVFLAAIRPI